MNHVDVNSVFSAVRRRAIAAKVPDIKAATGAPTDTKAARPADLPTLDAREFDDLSDMVGEDGVKEMIAIFEAETRRRLSRLRSGHQDIATAAREMHTLRGAAGTVAAPCLAALGGAFEQAAGRGIAPAPDDLKAIEQALETFLTAVRSRNGRQPAVR